MNTSNSGETTPRRICVIGAGASGIALIKVLNERGLDFDCFELSDRVGGNWVWGNNNGVSAAYNTLHINTSRRRMAFPDFPMPEDLPDFVRHDHVAAYFDDYVEHFGLKNLITFNTGVVHVERLPDGTFEVGLGTGEIRRYTDVCVANGHHWDPRMPDPGFPGADEFEGEQIHSHAYHSDAQLDGKRVVVLGMGNSAVDIAVDASYRAKSTVLAARSGVHIIPKYVFGRPYDQAAASELLPGWLRWPLARPLMKLNTGKMSRYGLAEPTHKFAQSHPTMSSRVLDRLAHGAITPKPNIASLGKDRVNFTDGTSVEADLLIYCTGYRISFPFLDAGILNPGADNRIELYRRIFHPQCPGLYFIGLVQPLGAVMPIAERQSQLVADHLQGRYALPPVASQLREIERYRARLARRYVASTRHTIQVDFDDYMRELRLERIRGRHRAAAESGPVSPAP